jgi:Uncharacterized protein conserved in bacteria
MKSVMKALTLGAALAVAVIGAAPAGDAKVGDISVSGAWARASAGPVPNGAAFMTIVNAGGGADKLLAASSDVAAATELHTHLHEDGVMKMRKVAAIDVAAGQTVMLQPGGYHVMFMGLKAPLKQGTTFPLILTFEKAGSVNVEVSVGEAGSMGPAGMGGMKNHGHMGGRH